MRIKTWQILVTVILIGLIAFGIVMIATRSNKDQSKTKDSSVKVYALEKEYAKGDNIGFKLVATTDVELERITYSLNNGTEVEIADVKISQNGTGLLKKGFTADTGMRIIDSSLMGVGHYFLVFYGYDAEGNKYELGEAPYQFKLIERVSDTSTYPVPNPNSGTNPGTIY